MRTALAATAALALLTACQPQDPTGAPAEAPADAPPASAAPPSVSDFSQPMTARGNEPFWAVSLDGTTLTLKRPGVPDVVFQAPGATLQPGQAVWEAKSADGQPLTLKLWVSDCSDGMSDARYPMTAEVVLATDSLRGCAAKTTELPKGQ